MSDGVFYVCEWCGREIDPEAPDTVKAVERQRIVTMGPTVEIIDGMGVLFHADCYPGGRDYRRTN
jgi:hypothetical protein